MGDWRLICLLAILAALLPAGPAEAVDDRRRPEGTGGWVGAGGPYPVDGRKDFECNADVAAASVAA